MNFPFSPSDEALLRLGRALKASGYHFITSTPLSHERVNERIENGWAKNERDVFGWSRPFQREILPDEIWDLMSAAQIVESHENGFRSALRLSSLSGELFWHSAFPTSETDAVFFGPDTYRYALAIENWIEKQAAREGNTSAWSTPGRIADIGAGSGAGAVVASRAFPDAEVLAGDINEAALRLTKINAALAGSQNVEAKQSDLLDGFEGAFDLILANPPYLVDDDERAYRHGGGPLGAGLSLQIVDAAQKRLAPKGTLLLYTGAAIVDGRDPFREEVASRLDNSGLEYSYREVDPDVFGEELEKGAYRNSERIAAVVLTLVKK